MAKTIVGLFDSFSEAQKAVDELVRSGFKRENISLVATEQARKATAGTTTSDDVSDAGTGAAVGATTGAVVGGAAGLIASLAGLTIPVIGPILAAGPIIAMLGGAGVGALAGGLIGALTSAGVPEEEARYYEHSVKSGGTLVTINAEDSMAEHAAEILDRNGAVDIRRRMAEWKSGATTTQKSFTGSTAVNQGQQVRKEEHATTPVRRTEDGEEIRVPVVEEELRVRKREVEQGGVRVHTKVTEKPVQEQVTLHEEKVNVERRPVDRPATSADLQTQPGEQTFEMRERREEAVVQKNARVVEEVVVNKEERKRTETINDTLRRKDVEVEQLPGHRGETLRYEDFDNDFRSYHTSAFASSGAYDQYAPAYRYGYTLAGNTQFAGKDWSYIESHARNDWERQSPGTWDRFKDQVRYAWNRVSEKVS